MDNVVNTNNIPTITPTQEMPEKCAITLYSPECTMCKLTLYYTWFASKKHPDIFFGKYNIDTDPEFRSTVKSLPAIFFYKNGQLIGNYYGANELEFNNSILILN